jgi:CDP-diacylglycerol--glycerol-3-phosphate 3-phosphatidyltransferase
VPFLVILIVAGGRPELAVAAGIFVAGAATDGIDGYLARRYGSTTRTGQWLDPLADKALVGAPVLTLMALGRFPIWAAAVIVAREVTIVLLRVALGLRGISLPASRAAKMKTASQLLAITLYILPLGASASSTKLALLCIAVVMTAATGVDYLVRAIGWVRTGTRPAPTGKPA